MDLVPIISSGSLIKTLLDQPLTGKWVEVMGEFRSFNKDGDDGRKHLDLYLFAKAINVYEYAEDAEYAEDVEDSYDCISNLIYFDGHICKNLGSRTTPFGKRIADFLIAVNRKYGKADFIPCIAWNRNAELQMAIGQRIRLYGRIQSREYFKSFSEDSDDGEYRIAYEVSVMWIEKVCD